MFVYKNTINAKNTYPYLCILDLKMQDISGFLFLFLLKVEHHTDYIDLLYKNIIAHNHQRYHFSSID